VLRPGPALLRSPEQARVRGLLRLRERWLQRCEGRAQFKAQLREPEQVQVRMDERAQVRGPVPVRERGHERTSHPDPERRLLRALERGPHKGQGFPLPSGG
jgi:hypothetical protein